ncbi:hypothetical protein GA0070615_6238 [Micromonospora aurantiaca]|nr:hypothetical protein GA0070615_6238 [Micromonospora aurantiaca]
MPVGHCGWQRRSCPSQPRRRPEREAAKIDCRRFPVFACASQHGCPSPGRLTPLRGAILLAPGGLLAPCARRGCAQEAVDHFQGFFRPVELPAQHLARLAVARSGNHLPAGLSDEPDVAAREATPRSVPPSPRYLIHDMIVRMFERVLCGLPANGSFAAILGTPAARLAAVGAVPVDPQIAPLPLGEVGRRLVQAGPPHDSPPDGRHHLAVARSAAQQHPHATRRYAAHRQAATDSLGNRRRSGGAGWRNPRFGEQALRGVARHGPRAADRARNRRDAAPPGPSGEERSRVSTTPRRVRPSGRARKASRVATTDEMGSTGTSITGPTTAAWRSSRLPSVVGTGAHRAGCRRRPARCLRHVRSLDLESAADSRTGAGLRPQAPAAHASRRRHGRPPWHQRAAGELLTAAGAEMQLAAEHVVDVR